ncbi:MAG: serine hydrolase [Gemmatimonas sp.]|nr:serine hydrolase [Gemmatimonas sp.]
MIRNRPLSSLLPAAIILSACAASQTSSSDPVPVRVELQRALDSLRVSSRFPGATLGVALEDGSTFALATGLADTAARVSMRADDRLHIGSVGKTFVAAIVLQLVEEGLLALDDPVSRWLGELPWYSRFPNASSLTVRTLLNHTSGIGVEEWDPDYFPTLLREPDKIWTVEERVRFLLDTPARYPVGEVWAYQDFNYHLIGAVIERVTGAPYEVELRRRLLEPLGLRETRPADRRELPGLVQGYATEGDPVPGPMIRDGRMLFNPQTEWTAGGMIATSEELARWMKLLFEGRAFDRALLPTMLDGVPASGVPWPNTRYGLGVFLRPTPLGMSYGHSGYFPGYRADAMYFPDHRIAVAVQLNTSARDATPTPTSEFLIQVARILLRPA